MTQSEVKLNQEDRSDISRLLKFAKNWVTRHGTGIFRISWGTSYLIVSGNQCVLVDTSLKFQRAGSE